VHVRVLPDEAAHSQYEMRSFVRSDSGVLYPTGQGRLAEASNPVPSNTVANLASPLSVPRAVPGTLPKPALPKPARERPKSKPGTTKGVRAAGGYPAASTAAAYQEEPSAGTSSSLDRQTVATPKEDHRARQSRLNAYDDAIESVLRRVLETHRDDDDDVIYDQIASDFTGNEDEPFIPPMVTAGRSTTIDRDERAAQIADAIDTVIARSFNDSEHSLSPPPAPVGSPPPYDDEDEIIEVHSVSPLKVEVTTDDILILPPPSPPAASPSPPLRNLAESKFVLEEEPKPVAPRRSKKQKNRQPAIGGYDEPTKPTSVDVPDRLKYGIPESYVRLEEMTDIGKAREIMDDEDDVGLPVPMDAAESLMKLAGIGPPSGIAPPPKRLRISYGSGRERTIEDTRDNSNDYEPETTPDRDLSYRDLGEGSRRSAVSEVMEQGQRSSRDERSKNRSRDVSAEVHDVPVASITEPVLGKLPAGKKGRPRKGSKKRGRPKKSALPPVANLFSLLMYLLLFMYVFCFTILTCFF